MFNLSISPSQTEIVIKPGSSFTQAYQIENNSDQSIYLNTSVLEWMPTDNQSQIQYLDQPNSSFSFSLLNADLKLGQDFIIKAKDKKQIVLKVNIDKDSPQNDSYFTFFINQIDLNASQNPGASGRIGAHLLISSSTNLSPQPKFNLKSLKTLPKIKDVFFTPLSFQIELENPTAYFQKPIGSLVIQKSGKDFRTIPLDSQNILANHSRQIFCLDNPTCLIKGPFWPGPYTAQIVLDNYTSPPQTFIILPLSPLAIILFFVSIYFIFRKIQTKKTNSIPPSQTPAS